MPFSPISVNSKTFLQSGEGRYMLSSVTFGDPVNYFQVKGGSLNRDRSGVTSAVTRVFEKDVTFNSVTTRKSATVQLVITLPTQGFTASEIDTLTSDISEFLDDTSLNRLLNGES